ncbi:MAG TPA: YqaJ viral recombinase family protein [Microbacteriaceae bacterium]|nr:YqaJ viral recombinase family protein [Microbacteriaceae bacterium]
MASHFTKRIVTDGTDRVAWFRARSRGVTATDVSKLSTPRSIETVANSKLYGSGFNGNVYTDHGREREPAIASWVKTEFDIDASQALFHAPFDTRHLATPDGITERVNGSLELAEIKTTNKTFRSIPRHYLRQMWWQQYVLGAERTLFVWEQHENFVPVGDPQYRWIDRDDEEIQKLLKLVDQLIDKLIEKTSR